MGDSTLETFGPFSIDRRRQTVARDGVPLAIGRRGYVLLETLIDAAGETVEKAALITRAWPGVIVEEGNLAVQIGTLRKALGGDAESVIVTVPRVGYRLVVPKQTATEPGGRPLIAVLPFANLGTDPDQAFFADGVVEDIITALSRFRQFAVVARNSSFVYRDRAVDVRVAAKELGVRYVLEGSVRRAGDRVRVTAQLVDADTGAHLWAEKLDGKLADIFDFQDTITESVVGLIEPQIRKSEIERTRRKRPESLDAYELFLRAGPLVLGTDKAGYGEAIAMLERAIALDPGYAPAYALLGWAHEKRFTFGLPAPAGVDDKELAVEMSEKALALDRDDAAVLAMAAWNVVLLEGDQDRGIALVRRALELNPNHLTALNFASLCYFSAGLIEESKDCTTRALRLSPGAPDSYWSLTNLAAISYFQTRFDVAVEWGLKALAVNSEWEATWGLLAAAYAKLGRMDECRAAVERLRAIRPGIDIDVIDREDIPRRPEHRALFREGLRMAGLS